MPGSCLLYYITDRTAFPGNEASRLRRLLEKIQEAVQSRVDYIQLREKDLPARDLESLAREAVSAVREARKLTAGQRPPTALLVNSRTDVAFAVGADGVHLRSDDISPQDVKQIWKCGAGAPDRENSPHAPAIGISCHSPEEVALAAANGADFTVFAPVFGKKDTHGNEAPAAGLEQLNKGCKASIPVLALGGVNLWNARSCLEAGAAGIAGIRLFQENDIGEVVKQLRG